MIELSDFLLKELRGFSSDFDEGSNVIDKIPENHAAHHFDKGDKGSFDVIYINQVEYCKA